MKYVARPIVALLTVGVLVAILVALPWGVPVSATTAPSVQPVNVVNSPTVKMAAGSKVTVATAPGAPLLVRNVGGGQGEPFQVRLNSGVQMIAPAGSQFVIEFMSGFCRIPIGQSLATLELIGTLGEPGLNNPPVNFYPIPVHFGIGPIADEFRFVHETRLRLTHLSWLTATSGGQAAVCAATLSGHVVPLS